MISEHQGIAYREVGALMDTGYDPPLPWDTVWECGDCAALIKDPPHHSTWHRGLERGSEPRL